MPFSFHEGLPEESALNVDPGIFHDADHVKLQAPSGWHTFYIQHHERVEGVVHFHQQKEKAASPYRSSFGSYLFSEEVTETELTEFIMYCENQLTIKGVKSITLKNQPEVYAARKNVLLFNVLNKLGYAIQKEESSAVIPISSMTFDSGLHKSEKKRLRKCREHALKFEIMPPGQLERIYIFIKTSREAKGYSLSMSFEEVKKLANTFPQRIVLTGVIDKNKIVAANISIRVYDHVLYNFYHDHSAEYDHLSPVVLLNEGLYQFSQKNNIQFLDLGTSHREGSLSESLLNFKLNLGAKASRKLTFIKNFA